MLTRLQREVVSTRESAHELLFELSTLENDYCRDQHLMKKFLALSLREKAQQRVAESMLFDEDRLANAREQRTVVQYLCLVLLPLYVMFAGLATLYYGAGIGRRAALVWAISLSVALGEDFLVVQPAAIWIRSVSVPSVAKRDFLALFFMLSTRARTLLTRKLHMMDNRNAVVQAFNPVCRPVA